MMEKDVTAGRVPGPSGQLASHLGTCVRPLPGEQWRRREAEVDGAAPGVDGEGRALLPSFGHLGCGPAGASSGSFLRPSCRSPPSPGAQLGVLEAPDGACLPSPACLAPDIGPIVPALDPSPRPAGAELPGQGGGAWQAS